MNIDKLLNDAQNGGWALKKLNMALTVGIPFNKPHKLKIVHLDQNSAEVSLPYTRRNLNHIKGIHACGLATLSEYTTGLLLLRNMSTKKYRLIMKSLHMDYHYQGKTNIRAEFLMKDEEIEKLQEALADGEAQIFTAVVSTYDTANNHITTGTVEWQLKEWGKVRMKGSNL